MTYMIKLMSLYKFLLSNKFKKIYIFFNKLFKTMKIMKKKTKIFNVA